MWFQVGFSWFQVGVQGSRSDFMAPGRFSWFFMVPGWFFMVPGRFSWFFMVPGWLFHVSRLVFFVFHGSRSVFMVFHGSRLVFHGFSYTFKKKAVVHH